MGCPRFMSRFVVGVVTLLIGVLQRLEQESIPVSDAIENGTALCQACHREAVEGNCFILQDACLLHSQ